MAPYTSTYRNAIDASGEIFKLTGGEKTEPWQWPDEKWQTIVSKIRAGRSLKPTAWKGGAEVAVALSFDSDHETQTLRFGDHSPGKLSAGEYGSRVAVPRILDLLGRHDIKASFFVPAVVAKLYPEEQKRIVSEGHEIGLHSWIHELNSELGYEDERDLQFRAADVLEAITGQRPVGIRTASWDFSPHTLKICREMELLYDSSLMADDDPYELLEDGEATGIVELPVEWIRDDAPYLMMDRFTPYRPYTPPRDVFDIFKSEFDGALEEKGLFLLTMHPHIVGHRSRMIELEGLINHIKRNAKVWFATHAEIAEYCLSEAETET